MSNSDFAVETLGIISGVIALVSFFIFLYKLVQYFILRKRGLNPSAQDIKYSITTFVVSSAIFLVMAWQWLQGLNGWGNTLG